MTAYTSKNTIANPRHPYAQSYTIDNLTAVGWTYEHLVDHEYLIPLDKIRAYLNETLTDPHIRDYVNDTINHYERLKVNGKSTLGGKVERIIAKYLNVYLDRPGSKFQQSLNSLLNDCDCSVRSFTQETTGNTDEINTPYSVLREAMVNDEYNLPKQILGRMIRKPEGRTVIVSTPRHKVSPFDGYDRKVAAMFTIHEGHDPDPFTEKQFNTDLRRRFKVRPSKLFNGTPIHVVIDDVAYENYELSVAYKELGL